MAELREVQNSFTIDTFRQNFVNGARSYLFYVIPSFPSKVTSFANNLKTRPVYLVQSSSIPSRTVNEVKVNWQGYEYNLGGNSKQDDWDITYVCDKTCGLYNAYLQWIDLVHNQTTNVHGDPRDYTVDQYVQLLSLDGKKAIADIKLVGTWCTSVESISLDYSTSDIIKFKASFKLLRTEYNII